MKNEKQTLVTIGGGSGQFMHPICSILLAVLYGMTQKSWHC